jgi:hypothetical protein
VICFPDLGSADDAPIRVPPPLASCIDEMDSSCD